MGRTVLLTGIPAIGKTTIIRKVIAELGDRAGGFYTEELTGPGGRKGFRMVTLTGETAILAHKDFRGPKVPLVGRYGVDVPALERVGVRALQRAVLQGQIVVIDEIGAMELYSAAFGQVVMSAIMGPSVVIGTITRDSYPEANIFKGLAQVAVWEVDRRNRDTLAEKVLAWLAA